MLSSHSAWWKSKSKGLWLYSSFCLLVIKNKLTYVVSVRWERILPLRIYGNFKTWKKNCDFFWLNVVISIYRRADSRITLVLHVWNCSRVMGLSTLGWVAKLALHRQIHGLGQQVHAQLLKFSQSLRGGKGRSLQFHPNFRTCSNTQQAIELLIESFLKPIVSSLFEEL